MPTPPTLRYAGTKGHSAGFQGVRAPEVKRQEGAHAALLEVQRKLVRRHAARRPAARHRRPALAGQVVAAKDGLVELVVRAGKPAAAQTRAGLPGRRTEFTPKGNCRLYVEPRKCSTPQPPTSDRAEMKLDTKLMIRVSYSKHLRTNG